MCYSEPAQPGGEWTPSTLDHYRPILWSGATFWTTTELGRECLKLLEFQAVPDAH
ncbi:MAG: hypothetical protein M3Y42_15785 [Actinomycetota bacterium]|nr:hypothetical protein [Actinomycetota bacterium]MDQ2958410.1 hypothetical protein [Actinomycetota bacterium]